MVSSLDLRPHLFATAAIQQQHHQNRPATITATNTTTTTSSPPQSQPPSAAMTSPKAASQSHHNSSFALQKYMLLQEQHQELCSHLDQIRPQPDSLTSTPSTSPTRSYNPSLPPPSPRGRRHHSRRARCSGWNDDRSELSTIPDEDTLYEISAEEQRLFDVNEGIKRALTELLNCSNVRADRSFRLWVQTRLMETEKELRLGRRRRTSAE